MLHAPLQFGQRVVRAQRHVRQGGTAVLGPQQLLHKAVHLLGQRLVQVVGGFVHRIAVRAPVVQFNGVQHFRQRGHYAVRAVSASLMALMDLMALVARVALIMAALS